MTLLVTGAAGFVMSVVARHWLEADADERLVVLDAAPLDAAAQRYFAPFKDRIKVLNCRHHPTRAMAPGAARGGYRSCRSRRHCYSDIARFCGRSSCRTRGGQSRPDHRRKRHGDRGRARLGAKSSRAPRFIYVSSGAVYKHHGPDRPGEPLPEDGYVMPRRLYGISKLASELITERYGDLFGIMSASVRLSSVYGTMDRVTSSRNHRHVPNRIAHMAMEGVKCVRVNTLEAVGDYVHSEDVARGIASLLRAPGLQYSSYNIAQGSVTSIGQLVEWAAERAPGFHAQVTAEQDADIVQDARLRDGMWGAYDISRIGRRLAGSRGPCAKRCTPTCNGSRRSGAHERFGQLYPRDLRVRPAPARSALAR